MLLIVSIFFSRLLISSSLVSSSLAIYEFSALLIICRSNYRGSSSSHKPHSTNRINGLLQVDVPVVPQGASYDADMDVNQVMGLSLTQAVTQSEELEKEENAPIHANTDWYAFHEWLDRAGGA
jgi:hypothetical protein